MPRKSITQTTPDGGSAFPADEFFDEKHIGTFKGMSLRDYFAAKALQGWLAGTLIDTHFFRFQGFNKAAMAADAYEFADAMLAERAK